MRKQLFVWSFLLALCLASSSATAGACKKITGSVGAADYYTGCSYDGMEYHHCVETPVKGKLKGTWRFFSNPDFNAVELTTPDNPDDLGIGSWDLGSGGGLGAGCI